MRKHRFITARRSLRFEALEGRQLLSAGPIGPPPVAQIVVVGPPAPDLGPGPAELAPTGGLLLISAPSDVTGIWLQGGLVSPGLNALESAPGDDLAPMLAYPANGPNAAPALLMESSGFAGANPGSLVIVSDFPAGPVSNAMAFSFQSSPGVGTASMMTNGWGPAPVTGQSPTAMNVWTSGTNSLEDSGPSINPMIAGLNGYGPGASMNPGGEPSDMIGAQDPDSALTKAAVQSDQGFATNPPLFNAQQLWSMTRGRPDLFDTGPSQSTTVNSYASSDGVLNSPSQQGLVVTVGLGPTSPAVGKSIDGPVTLAGINAPVQPNTLLELDGIGFEHLASSGGYQERGIGIVPVPLGRISRLSALSAHDWGPLHSTVSLAHATNVRAFDEFHQEIPAPRRADLIAEALPLTRESLEHALENFVIQLGEMDLGLSSTQGPTPIIVLSVAVVTSVASAELARRYMQRRYVLNRGVVAIDPHGRQQTLGFPELPGSWSERRE